MPSVLGGLDKNPALAQHLESLRTRGAASDADIEQVRQLAGHLSAQAGHAVREARTSVTVSPEARRMLDPKHPTKVPTLERALAALGRRAEIEVS